MAYPGFSAEAALGRGLLHPNLWLEVRWHGRANEIVPPGLQLPGMAGVPAPSPAVPSSASTRVRNASTASRGPGSRSAIHAFNRLAVDRRSDLDTGKDTTDVDT
jgi:hypothetical protein